MKIFWSWQSDHDGKISRHLIRDALRDAVKILKDDPDITEPSEREALDELHVDQDRQNVAGSPDLANTILEKISSALVVVADVTPVARGKITTEHPTGRGVMNPNVAIELGYALGKLSTNRVLMVLNEHFGKRSDLPFDLQHKAGPISYYLSPEASLEDQKKEQSKLTGYLVTALRLYVVDSQTSSSFAKAPFGANDFVFFPAGAPMAEGGLPGFADPFDYLIDPYSVLSVRCFPLKAQGEFTYTELSQAALKLSPFSNTQRGLNRHNDWGVVGIDPADDQGNIDALSQVFFSGEIWALNSKILRNSRHHGWLSIFAIENILHTRVPQFLQLQAEQLNLRPPFQIEIGLIGYQGLPVLLDPAWKGATRSVGNSAGPFTTTVADTEPKIVRSALVNLYEQLYRSVTREQRPPQFDQKLLEAGL